MAVIAPDTGTAVDLLALSISRGSDGRLIVSGLGDRNSIMAWTASRVWVTIGRLGAGPGEFRRPTATWFGSADSIFVYDQALRRVSVFGPGGKFFRSFVINNRKVLQILSLGGGRVGINGPGASPGNVLDNLAVYDVAGREVLALADSPEMLRPDRPLAQHRRLAARDDGGIWSARPNRSTIVGVAPDGRLDSVVLRGGLIRNWSEAAPEDAGRVVNPPAIEALWSAGMGMLGVVIISASPDWSPPRVATGQADRGGGPTIELLRRRYRMSIEYYDIRNGQRVAVMTLDRLLIPLQQAGWFADLVDKGDGLYAVRIVEVLPPSR